MSDSIFTRIIKGEIPCHKIYEDDHTIAFMDIHPVQSGMVLVVPKLQIDHFMDLPDPEYQALMSTVKKVAQKMHEVFPNKRIGVQIEGLDIPHAHIKLLPFSSGDEYRAQPSLKSEPDHATLGQMAKKLQVL